MSIDRETVEPSTEVELEDRSAADHVRRLLASNDDRAFKTRATVRHTELDEGAVSTALTR